MLEHLVFKTQIYVPYVFSEGVKVLSQTHFPVEVFKVESGGQQATKTLETDPAL